MLDRSTHQRIDQLVENDFTSEGLADACHGGEVELFDRGADRVGRSTGGGFLHRQVRMELVELKDFASCAPSEIAVAGISQVRIRDGPEPTGSVEASRKFVRERFVVDEIVLASRPDRRFIQALRIEFSPLDASNLGADQQRTVLEILWTILRPYTQLFVLSGQRLEMLVVLTGARGIAGRGMAERAIETGLGRLKEWRGCPEQALCVQRGFHRRPVVSRNEARLHLSYPVPTCSHRYGRVARQVPLKRQFIEPLVVKAAERRGETAECPDQRKLGRDNVDHHPEAAFPGELEA